jgi:hypothetical protein
MARSAVTITSLAGNTWGAQPTGNDLDPTNGHVITPTCPVHELVIEITHTTASSKNITVKAGDNPPANAQGKGDLVEAFADGSVTPVVKRVVLDSSRFLQDDGTINIDVGASATGKIRCFRVPRV